MKRDVEKLRISYNDLTKEQLIEILLKIEKKKQERRKRRRQKREEKSSFLEKKKEVVEYEEAQNFFEILQKVCPTWSEFKKRRRKDVAHALGQLLKEYPDHDHLSIAKRMIEWCLDHKKEVGLSRYRTFLKKQQEWKKEADDEVPDDFEEQERLRTKEYLKQYGGTDT